MAAAAGAPATAGAREATGEDSDSSSDGLAHGHPRRAGLLAATRAARSALHAAVGLAFLSYEAEAARILKTAEAAVQAALAVLATTALRTPGEAVPRKYRRPRRPRRAGDSGPDALGVYAESKCVDKEQSEHYEKALGDAMAQEPASESKVVMQEAVAARDEQTNAHDGHDHHEKEKTEEESRYLVRYLECARGTGASQASDECAAEREKPRRKLQLQLSEASTAPSIGEAGEAAGEARDCFQREHGRVHGTQCTSAYSPSDRTRPWLYEFEAMASTLIDRGKRHGKGTTRDKASIVRILKSMAAACGHFILEDNAAMITEAEYNALLSLTEPAL